MKKAVYLGLSSVLFVLSLAVFGPHPENYFSTENEKGESREEGMEEEEGKIPLRDRMDMAMAQEIRMTKDPLTGEVPRERLLDARRYADELRATNKTTAALNVKWTERGPSNVAGRTRAIIVDPNDATGNTVFAGSVGGGIWKCTNINTTAPIWTEIDGSMSNIAIASLEVDPSNPLIMYAGTGEGYFNGDAIRGLGIFKSTDGGTTWAQIASTNNATFRFVQRIAVNSTGVVFACTSTGGLQRSANGGTTWTKVLGTGLGITGAGTNFAYDVEVAANGDVFATIDGSIHKSTNAGVTFAAAMTLPIAVGRVELSCAPNDANYVYAICENGNVVAGILRTTNGGTTWTSRTEPADADTGIPNTDCSRGQAWYDLSIAVDPNNRDRLFVGGVDIFVSGDGAGTWTQVTHWYGGFGFQNVHADQHIAIFQPGSSTIAYFGNDGGIYRTANGNAATPTLTFKGDDYNVTQFYACAMHPTFASNYFLAGAQDNGSQQFSSGGINATVEATGGDGAFCHIDQDQPQFQWTAYVQNSFYRSADGGATWTNVSTAGGQFISPTDYDNVGNRMYGNSGNNNYLRWDNPQSGNTFAVVPVAAFGSDVACVTCSPNTANRVFFGISNGHVFRVDNAHTGTPTATNISTGLPGGYPSCIEVETGNDNHLLVCYANFGVNSIWESTNGGTSWTSVEGNMPDMPVRWLLLNPTDNTQALAATELGVWYTDALAGGATVWQPGNSGLANVRTDMLQLRSSDKLVAAATHGRGLFTSDVFADPLALFSADHAVQYLSRPVQFHDDSYGATSWAWNFGDGNTSTLQHPSYIYPSPGLYNVTLTINSGASTLTKNGFIQILPDLGTPYAPADGGNFEIPNVLHFGAENRAGTPWERGNSAVAGKSGFVSSSNAWVTGLVGNYVSNTNAELYGPSFNFTSIGTYTLRFQSKFSTEAGYDAYRVEYSTDRGNNWTVLAPAVAASWYNNANGSGTSIFPGGEAFFSGSATTYALKTKDVSFLAGNPSVAFRFVFKSDESVVAAGAAIDDFEILGPPNTGGFPVTGSPLTGAWTSSQPNLSWTTFVEQNNRGFAIERSVDGIGFEEIDFVNGQGNSSASQRYLYQDNSALLSHYFYRLRQVDVDGNFSFSNAVELRKGADGLSISSIYPNPFERNLSIAIKNPGSGAADVQLYDLTGRKMLELQAVSTAGNLIELQNLELPAGTYLLRLTMGAETLTRKVVRR